MKILLSILMSSEFFFNFFLEYIDCHVYNIVIITLQDFNVIFLRNIIFLESALDLGFF